MIIWFLSQLKKLLKALNSGQRPEELAGSIVFGLFLGLPPFNLLYFSVVFLMLLFANVNISLAILVLFISKLFAGSIDMIADAIGGFVLVDITWLKGLWTFFYNLPIVPFSNFNNTVMMGSIVFTALIAFPVYLLSEYLITMYQRKLKEKVENSPIMKAIKASKIVTVFTRFLSD